MGRPAHSTLSLADLGEAMRALDPASIPLDKRKHAIKLRLLDLMGQTLVDPAERMVARGALLLEQEAEARR
jgi:hypothetical protein